MEIILRQNKQLFVALMLVAFIPSSFAQVKHHVAKTRPHTSLSPLQEFKNLAAQANVTFSFPDGFKEIKAPNNEYFSFDYAIELPGKGFEIWFRVKSEKANWASYMRAKNNQLTNPDSLYIAASRAEAIALSGNKNYLVRNIPQHALTGYNADAGKSYLLSLLDMPVTKHYKYALLITLQKNHIGNIVAVCFTNEKGPDFFKNIHLAGNCLKFNP
ncbi:MAG: hypothetical protein M3N14_03245 [Bacteroidota bacterium]|nr:hypothetical protein [Bacteroidota bacterium]